MNAAAVALTVAAGLLTASPAAAQQASYLDNVVVFEFAADTTSDEYLFWVFDIARKELLDQMAESRSVRNVIPAQDGDSSAWRRVAGELGASHYVGGSFTPLRDNMLIKTSWFEWRSNRRGTIQAIIGTESLQDLELVAAEVRSLGEALVRQMTGRDRSEILRVTCFSSTAESGNPMLDLAITLGLPDQLIRHMGAEGISTGVLAVQGLSLDEYYAECQTRGGRTRDRKSRLDRYELSGSIRLTGEQMEVQPLLYDQERRVSIPIRLDESFDLSSAVPIEGLADPIAGAVLTYLAQDRLALGGFFRGYPDGVAEGVEYISALRRFQSSQGLPTTGELDDATMSELGL